MGRDAQVLAPPSLGKHTAEVVALLAGVGVDHRQAKILAYLANVPEARSSVLERACRLRQPEVSIATRELRRTGWVDAEERRGEGKGRPVNFYRLAVPFAEVVEAIASERRRAAEEELEKVARLRKVLASLDRPPVPVPLPRTA